MRYAATVDFEGRTMDDYWRMHQGYAGEPVDGLIVAVGGAADDGMRIISIWESKADHDRFIAERLHPVLRQAGSPGGMTFTEFAVADVTFGAVIPPRGGTAMTANQDEDERNAT